SGCFIFHKKPEPKSVTIGGVLTEKINPILVSESTLVAIDASIFDGLTRTNDQLEIIPHLAEQWEYSSDRKTLLIKLRTGVKFHDGVELTAEDVKFTYDAIMQPEVGSYLSSEFAAVDRIEVEGRSHLRIFFKEPNTNFLYTMRVGILPKHCLTFTDLTNPHFEFNRHPIGTGPFKVETWTDALLTLTANPVYFLGKPNLDRIMVRSLPNQTVMWTQLMTEQIDVTEDILPEDYKILLTNTKVQGYKTPTRHYYMVLLNNRSPLFADPKVRRALNYAIDKQAIIDEVLLGEGTFSGSIFPADSYLYNRSVTKYEYQPRVAQKLLREAGWVQDKKTRQLMKNGLPFEFTLLIDQDNILKRQIALILDQQLQELGIKMHLKSLPVSTLINDYLLPKKFDACIAEMDTLYETNFGYVFFHSGQINHGLNAQSYRNPMLDTLYDQIQVTVDAEARKKLFDQIQYELAQNPPGIFLFFPHRLAGVNKKFANIKPRSNDNILWNLKDWDVKASPKS
ncbi:MAG: ABC transporter substrate-binding protein, partial [bacterium]|nr:ABC transporter substrate-binding protein [bacterium]